MPDRASAPFLSHDFARRLKLEYEPASAWSLPVRILDLMAELDAVACPAAAREAEQIEEQDQEPPGDLRAIKNRASRDRIGP